MADAPRTVVHVIENPGGWWDVKTQAGSLLAQFTTEFQARESGRITAQRLHADLIIYQDPAPALHWTFDEADGTIKPR